MLFTLETWISRLGKNTFSDLKNEGNFHSLRGTLKRCVHESAKIAYSDCQNAKNLLTRNLVHADKLQTRSLVPLKRGFLTTAK